MLVFLAITPARVEVNNNAKGIDRIIPKLLLALLEKPTKAHDIELMSNKLIAMKS